MTQDYKDSVNTFLKAKNIAIAGYSTNPNQPANAIYKRFTDAGYNVFAVNPKADTVTNVKCYPSIKDVSEPLDAVVICTHPNVTFSVVNECIDRKINNIWIHRSVDQGSYNKEAVELSKEKGINCISVGCPLMFLNADFGHKCIRWFMNVSGKLKN